MEPAEWDRWYRRKREVVNEPGLVDWRIVLHKLESEREDIKDAVPMEIRQKITEANYTVSHLKELYHLHHKVRTRDQDNTRLHNAVRGMRQALDRNSQRADGSDFQSSLGQSSECQCPSELGWSFP